MKFRAICDLFLPNGHYAQAGDILTDGDIPVGWKPPLAVDPIDREALQAFFDQGPPTASGEMSLWWCGHRWDRKPVLPPEHYWKLTMRDGHRAWVINDAEGLGSS